MSEKPREYAVLIVPFPGVPALEVEANPRWGDIRIKVGGVEIRVVQHDADMSVYLMPDNKLLVTTEV